MGMKEEQENEQMDYKKFILKEYLVWAVCWIVILATYIILGVKLEIFNIIGIPYIVVGMIIGALILRTHIKVKTALILLEDFAQSLSEELQKEEQIK